MATRRAKHQRPAFFPHLLFLLLFYHQNDKPQIKVLQPPGGQAWVTAGFTDEPQGQGSFFTRQTRFYDDPRLPQSSITNGDFEPNLPISLLGSELIGNRRSRGYTKPELDITRTDLDLDSCLPPSFSTSEASTPFPPASYLPNCKIPLAAYSVDGDEDNIKEILPLPTTLASRAVVLPPDNSGSSDEDDILALKLTTTTSVTAAPHQMSLGLPPSQPACKSSPSHVDSDDANNFLVPQDTGDDSHLPPFQGPPGFGEGRVVESPNFKQTAPPLGVQHLPASQRHEESTDDGPVM